MPGFRALLHPVLWVRLAQGTVSAVHCSGVSPCHLWMVRDGTLEAASYQGAPGGRALDVQLPSMPCDGDGMGAGEEE